MRDITYKSLVEVDILLHSFLVVDSCDIPLVLYLFQSLFLLVLCLCSHIDPLVAHYTEVHDCTMRYCTEVALCCTMVVRYYMVVVKYYTGVAQLCMGMEPG